MHFGIARPIFQRGFVQADRARKFARGRFCVRVFTLLCVPRRDHSITAGTKQRDQHPQNASMHCANLITAASKTAMCSQSKAVRVFSASSRKLTSDAAGTQTFSLCPAPNAF